MKKREQGFTLVEVLVALVVTVAALTVLAQGFATGARASTGSQNATRAALLAQQVITDLETGELPLNQSQSGAFEHDPDYTYETRSETGDPGLTKITVTVAWEQRGEARTYVLTRLMRERPTPQ